MDSNTYVSNLLRDKSQLVLFFLKCNNNDVQVMLNVSSAIRT